jgi:hypothetical protein
LALSDAAATLAVEPMGPNVDSRDAVKKHLAEQRHRINQLRPLLGIAKALGRALILPRMLCYCDFMWKEMQNCRVGGAESMRLPFDCPMDHVLDTPKWFENELGVGVREPSFLKNLAAARPAFAANVTSSIAKVSLRMTPLNDEGVIAALKPHEDARIIELSDARKDVSRLAVHREAAMEFKRNKDLLEVVKLKLPAGDMSRVNEELNELRSSLQQAERSKRSTSIAIQSSM